MRHLSRSEGHFRHGVGHALLTGVFIAIAVPASAQMTSSRGMTGNMDVSRLQRQVLRLTDNIQTVQGQIKHFQDCATDGLVYAPGDDNRDAKGCVHTSPRPCRIAGKIYESGEPITFTHFAGIAHYTPARCYGSSPMGMGHCDPASTKVIAPPDTVLKICVDGRAKVIHRKEISRTP